MSRAIKDLQKLIEERAISKLKKDLQNLSDLIHKQPLLNSNAPRLYIANTLDAKVQGVDGCDIFRLAFQETSENGTSYRARLYQFWLPIYIERESAEFLKNVDDLSNNVNDLLTFKDQQEGCL